MSTGKIVLSVVGTLVLIAVLMVIGFGGRMFQNKLDTQYNQYSDSAVLKKYEDFKNMHAALDAKRADITIATSNIKAIEDANKGVARKDWSRDDRSDWSQKRAELSGIQMSYNSLAAEYNAQMSKDNWQFANKGTLPAGATEPLPREAAPYLNSGDKE
jgi:hypothetical protein